ncbi:MAG: STAS domain-containing protein [Bacteroidia bacterium]
MAFEFGMDEEAGFPVLCLEGSLMEKHQAEDLMEEVQELLIEGSNNLILDLSNLNYLNSSGLNVLLNILTRARNAGGEVIISGVNERLKNLLVITKLNAVFQFSENPGEAVKRLKTPDNPQEQK